MKKEKEWWQLEDEYERRYRNGTVATDLWKYIPKDKLEGVTNAFSDSEGYWIWLDCEEGGWRAYDGAEDCGTIHEYTIEGLRKAIKTIRKYS